MPLRGHHANLSSSDSPQNITTDSLGTLALCHPRRNRVNPSLHRTSRLDPAALQANHSGPWMRDAQLRLARSSLGAAC
eukprot:1297775-Rhodomonas_salina.2